MKLSLALVAAAIAGFVALSYEILWYRAYGMVSRSMPSTFGLLLGAYLAGVAVGSLATRPLATPDRSPRRLFSVALLAYLANVASFLVIPTLARWVTTRPYQGSLALVALAAGLMGAVFPLVAHHGIAPDDRAGARLSYVYVANIVGSSAGSLVTGFVVLEHLSLRGASVLLGVVGLGLFLFLGLRARPTLSLALAAVGVAFFTLASPMLFDRVYERLFFRRSFSANKRFDTLVENRHGVIAVTEGRVYGGGVYDGILNVGLRDDPNWVFRAYALHAYHPAPRRVLMVGLASGAWARILASLPGVEHLRVIEINPGYLAVIAGHDEVRPILHDPKLEIVIDDGRRYLQRHPHERYDAIVMNTTWHWRDHATNLLSREFFHTVRSQLAPGGVFLFNTTLSEAVMVTSARTFPHAERLYNFMVASDAPVVFDAGRWERLLRTHRIDGAPLLDLADAHDRGRFDALMRLAGPLDRESEWEARESGPHLLARFGQLPDVTDDNMWSEWHPSDLNDE